MSPAVGHRARISPCMPRCGTSLTPSAACQNHHTNETYPAHSRHSREQRSARRYLQVEKVNISLWGPVACFWTQCSILEQAGVLLLDFSAARGVAFPNLCTVPAWKSPGNGFGVSSWRAPGWPLGYYFHLHCSHMPADYYWMCKACCWLQLAGNWVWLKSIFFKNFFLVFCDRNENLLQNPIFFILVKIKHSQIQIKHIKCSEYFPHDAVCQSIWIFSSNGIFPPTFSSWTKKKKNILPSTSGEII